MIQHLSVLHHPGMNICAFSFLEDYYPFLFSPTLFVTGRPASSNLKKKNHSPDLFLGWFVDGQH
jgi:hypothetical protein